MHTPHALFIDLNRVTVDHWPEGHFSIGYIVTADMDRTQDFFKTHYQPLKTIPHITCEITVPEVLHLLTRQQSVTRLSLAHDLIVDGLADHFALDAIITWDHRRTVDFHKDKIARVLEQGAPHISLYGLQDFAAWQKIQSFLNAYGLFFYDRFHAAKTTEQSPYQNHISHFGNVVALGGWSRIVENNVMRIKGPNAKDWTTHPDEAKREEMLLLGLFSRHGVLLGYFSQAQTQSAIKSGLALIQGDRLCPTDAGLWDTTKLVALVV